MTTTYLKHSETSHDESSYDVFFSLMHIEQVANQVHLTDFLTGNITKV
jgi:hypothetical protein